MSQSSLSPTERHTYCVRECVCVSFYSALVEVPAVLCVCVCRTILLSQKFLQSNSTVCVCECVCVCVSESENDSEIVCTCVYEHVYMPDCSLRSLHINVDLTTVL